MIYNSSLNIETSSLRDEVLTLFKQFYNSYEAERSEEDGRRFWITGYARDRKQML